MSSSELLICKMCGKEFPTLDDLREHMELERKEQVLRNKGYDDG
ncbi:MAG TPA: C2H2-type zinc finger protein [Nitrososphaera sp.]|jgi:hypothetical protein